ncbi:MAG: glycoside hydrolase family 43 protein [Clostridia bacterium]|nr:glycoside hydrolase family 43 protein [Clostridia bacterium]
MALRYPKNPRFHKLQMRSSDYRKWQEGCAHDPSLFEWNGTYYVYSTDTFGAPNGYQIRKSDDLLHWEYVGSAFHMDGVAPHYKKREANGAYGGLQPAYDWCVTHPSEVGYGICTRRDGTMAFWAPHCVKGADGKIWLYFCLTGYFGGSKSCIGLAKADSPEGPFQFEGLLVQSPAGWRTPNAIDPQFFHAEGGKAFLVYGSYGMGLYVIELDPQTGLRKDGRTYDDFSAKKCTFREYYGAHVASGSIEGGVVHYHEGVDVLENGVWTKKNYYYLMCSYGSLSSVYNMRCGRSETPEGPYVDVNGNELICSTDIGTGNKMLGSFRWEGAEIDFFCPGHNDMYVTASGVNLISYHCRTNYFIEKKQSRSNNFHYVYLSQYAFNSDGWPVMNANRYAQEEVQDVTADQLLNITAGKFEAVAFTQGADSITAKRIELRADGTVTGAYPGTWEMYGKHYIRLNVFGDEYLGVVMPAWLDDQNVAGLTVTAMGRQSGMALHLNSTIKI